MKISTKKSLLVAGLFSAFLLAGLGCNGPRPLAPSQNVNLGVSVAPSKDVQASLLGTTSNILLWNIRGNTDTGIHGQQGPFSSAAGAGNVNFTLNVPVGGVKILSVQLNDATTNQPLAVGAVAIDLSNPTSNMSVSLLLGSITRLCYTMDNGVLLTCYDLNDHVDFYPEYPPYQADTEVFYGDTNYWLDDPNGNATIAYLGNGNLVDYDFVPPDNQFSPYSGESKSQVINPSANKPTPVPTSGGSARKNAKAVTGPNLDLATGDIYCIKTTMLPGGYAWLQITNPGNYANEVGPSFCFRLSTNPYYSYYQTPADLLQNCYWTTTGTGTGGGTGGAPPGGGGGGD
jgi:hypothetical protein